MSSMRVLQLPASPTAIGLPGCWTLPRDRAITLDAREPGYLRLAHGAVWATLDGPHAQGQANEWGDVVLRCGAHIRLGPGQQVVLESYPDAANEDACFSWVPEVSEQASAWTVRAAIWRRLTGLGASLADGLGRWLEPGPGWPRYSPELHAHMRDQAWRSLYHLGINQP